MNAPISTRICLSLLAAAVGLAASSAALAGPANKVYRPIVEKGETELAIRGGYRDYDGNVDEYAYLFEVAFGVTDRWKTELLVEYSGETGFGGRYEAIEWENVLVLTEQGQHWMDVGLLLEYEHTFADGPDELKIGALFEKEIGPTIVDLNLVFERAIGDGAGDAVELDYGWQVKWRGNEALEWGVQGIGGLGEVGKLGDGAEHSVGPALFGVKRLANGNKIAYDAAVLAGINDAAPNLTVRFQLEYEIYNR